MSVNGTERRGVAIVTGAGRGIGLAIANTLAASGFDVASVSLEARPADLEQPAQGGRSAYYSADIADLGAHDKLLDRIRAELGPITCLVNNACVTSLVRGDMLALTPESLDRSVSVNLRGTFFLTQAVAKGMIDRAEDERFRSIITISSANAEIIGVNRADYCMTKAALSMMNKLFATRLAEAGIGVFEIRPGIIATDMTAPARQTYQPFIEGGGVPMRRWGTPQDVAHAVGTLACGGLAYATGFHLDIGGGMQLHRV